MNGAFGRCLYVLEISPLAGSNPVGERERFHAVIIHNDCVRVTVMYMLPSGRMDSCKESVSPSASNSACNSWYCSVGKSTDHLLCYRAGNDAPALKFTAGESVMPLPPFPGAFRIRTFKPFPIDLGEFPVQAVHYSLGPLRKRLIFSCISALAYTV